MNYKDMSDDELAKALKDYAEHRSGEIADLTYAASLRISVLSAGGNRSEWIPVSKREPEEYGEYMITWTTSHSMAGGKGLIGDAEYELTNEYDHEKNRFKGEWLLPEYIQNYPDVKVIAWMPLPEPYKAESEDKRMGFEELPVGKHTFEL